MIAGFVFCVARFSPRFCCRSVAVNDAPLHVDGSAGRLHCCTTVQGASPRTKKTTFSFRKVYCFCFLISGHFRVSLHGNTPASHN